MQSFTCCELVCRVADHGCGAAGVAIGVDEGCALDAIVPLPVDCKRCFGFFDVERFGVALAGEPERQMVVAIDDPSIAGLAGKQRELTDRDDAPIVIGGAALDVSMIRINGADGMFPNRSSPALNRQAGADPFRDRPDAIR